jgi:hypothetical protein
MKDVWIRNDCAGRRYFHADNFDTTTTSIGPLFPVTSGQNYHCSAPKSVSDLYAQADEALIALGFEGPIWLLRESEPAEVGYQPLCAVYRHRDKGSLAWLMPPISPAMPNRLLGYWTTKLKDGTLVTSQPFGYRKNKCPFFPSPAVVCHC